MSEDMLNFPEGEKPTGQQALAIDLYFWLQALVSALVVLILIFTFIGRIVGVDGASMEPTLHHGDMLILQSLGYTPAQGDVVVLATQDFHSGVPIVKRIIAVGGQTVQIDYDADTVTVDGVVLDEPYINEQDMRALPMGYLTEITVPEGEVFVMGDNRNNSSDGRDARIGSVDEGEILGVARIILFPFQDFGVVKSISQAK